MIGVNTLGKYALPIVFFLFLIAVFPLFASADPDFSGCDVNITNASIPYTIDQNDTVYCLNESIGIDGLNGINFSYNVQNSTIDCLGYSIVGNDSDASAIVINGSSVQNNTVKNCDIKDFYYGIYIGNTTNNTVINNTVNSSAYGILLSNSSNCSKCHSPLTVQITIN